MINKYYISVTDAASVKLMSDKKNSMWKFIVFVSRLNIVLKITFTGGGPITPEVLKKIFVDIEHF